MLHDGPISPDLYHEYSNNLRRGVSITLCNDFPELEAQLLANVSRFAAYKAYQATQKVKESASEGDIEDAKFWIRKFNSWQAAEYNTTVSRSRTAKQWAEWDNPEDRELMPNIKWLPSRSVNIREEHKEFYWKIWPKDDPFWKENQPGNLWNCKCDWQQTDEEPTENNPASSIHHKGLEGNPAETGRIFSDEATYIRNAPASAERECNKAVFKSELAYAREHFQRKTVYNKTFNEGIEISGGGIKEFMNQPCEDYFAKNAIAFYLDRFIQESTHTGSTFWKGRNTEKFETKIANKTYYIICIHSNDGKLRFHSVSDSPKVYK